MISFFRSILAPPRHLILLLAALWIGLALAEKRAAQHNVSKEALNNIVYYGLFGYILGGRLLYALENLPAFAQSPLSLISLNLDLFDPLSGLIVAVIVGFVYGFREKLPLRPTLDALTPLFAMLMVGLALSHLAAGTAFGSPTDLPWGIELWNATRHPTQIYELIAALLILAIIWFRNGVTASGSDFLSFIALTAGARLFLEAFRGDSSLIVGGLRLAQILAWLILFVTLVIYERLQREGEIESAM